MEIVLIVMMLFYDNSNNLTARRFMSTAPSIEVCQQAAQDIVKRWKAENISSPVIWSCETIQRPVKT